MNDSAMWSEVGARLAPPLPPVTEPRSPIQARRRRGFAAARDDGREAVELVRDDGVLRWVWRPAELQLSQGRRAWRSMGLGAGDLVQRIEYPPLGRNQITDALMALDVTLNPDRGLRRWEGQGWRAVRPGELQALRGRVLLLVHGTFSKSGMYDSELQATEPGRQLFGRWVGTAGSGARRYAAVLAFDHATLSESPWLNAVALREALEPLKARIDVVCHSRGGLVTAWALKMGAMPVDQVVFVGSPLMGTSLASPVRLREALDLLANIADAMSMIAKGAGTVFPPAALLALGVAGLARVLGRALHLGAGLPLPDAAVGLVPGLMSQSRVENNLELTQLFPLPGSVLVSGLGVEFKPDVVGQPVWKFWNRFAHIADQAKYYGAEVIFQQPNDLVVDTASMNQLGRQALIGDFKLLADSAGTHHCSYFRNAEAIRFLSDRLT